MSCPVCKRKSDAAYRPFCSKRCADVDLAKWMSGSYAIPSDDPEDLDAAERALEQQQRKPH
ncbi:DNA gyrase inhibitor YacG [Citreimonas sp.]|uniref:DNA gyrase inhibitor YacG n=1 Tax=Citreimonas sp. TaxID=3036715 RepID=UPI0035C7EA6A